MEPYTVTLSRKRNEKPGYLVPIEETDIGFPIRRVFYISGMDQEGHRGYHGHRETTTQGLICLHGTVEVQAGSKHVLLNQDNLVLIVPPDNFIVMKLSKDAILLVLCSTLYKEDVLFQQNEVLSTSRNGTDQ